MLMDREGVYVKAANEVLNVKHAYNQQTAHINN